jgi:hypothetical protein
MFRQPLSNSIFTHSLSEDRFGCNPIHIEERQEAFRNGKDVEPNGQELLAAAVDLGTAFGCLSVNKVRPNCDTASDDGRRGHTSPINLPRSTDAQNPRIGGAATRVDTGHVGFPGADTFRQAIGSSHQQFAFVRADLKLCWAQHRDLAKCSIAAAPADDSERSLNLQLAGRHRKIDRAATHLGANGVSVLLHGRFRGGQQVQLAGSSGQSQRSVRLCGESVARTDVNATLRRSAAQECVVRSHDHAN